MTICAAMLTTSYQVTSKPSVELSLGIPHGPRVIWHPLSCEQKATKLRHRAETIKFALYFSSGKT